MDSQYFTVFFSIFNLFILAANGQWQPYGQWGLQGLQTLQGLQGLQGLQRLQGLQGLNNYNQYNPYSQTPYYQPQQYNGYYPNQYSSFPNQGQYNAYNPYNYGDTSRTNIPQVSQPSPQPAQQIPPQISQPTPTIINNTPEKTQEPILENQHQLANEIRKDEAHLPQKVDNKITEGIGQQQATSSPYESPDGRLGALDARIDLKSTENSANPSDEGLTFRDRRLRKKATYSR